MIYRVKHNSDNPYFMLNRHAAEDDQLSYKALGILTYLLSKPDNWTVYEVDLEKRHTDGLSSVRSGLKELRDRGYIVKLSIRDDKGKITHWETHVYEAPTLSRIHIQENPDSGLSTCGEIASLVSNESIGITDLKENKEKKEDLARPVMDEATKEVSNLLQHVGVGLSVYIIDHYMDLVSECGLPSTISGIQAAADQNKQHSRQYVSKCIRNIAQGNKVVSKKKTLNGSTVTVVNQYTGEMEQVTL